jgi:hypothetical protein
MRLYCAKQLPLVVLLLAVPLLVACSASLSNSGHLTLTTGPMLLTDRRHFTDTTRSP